MASRSSGFWRRARCSTSMASSGFAGSGLGQRQRLQRRGKGRIDLERLLDRRDGIRHAAGEIQHEAQHVMEAGAFGCQRQGLLGLGNRLVVAAHAAQRQRAVALDLGAPWRLVAGVAQGELEELERRLEMAEAVKHVAQHVAAARLHRPELCPVGVLQRTVEVADHLGQLALGGGEAVLVDMDAGERQPRLDMRRRAADGVAETLGRLIELAQPARHQAEIVGQHRLVGILGDRLAPQHLGFAQRAALRQADRQVMQDLGPVAVAGMRRAEQRLGAIEPAGAQILQAGLKIGIGLDLGRRLPWRAV